MAIDADPTYASAHALMAHTYVYLADDIMPSKEAIAKARKSAENALKLDDTLAEAYVALALVKFEYDWEWDEAERDFKRALELNPGDALTHNLYGNYLVEMGRFAEAQKQMDRAYELDPLTGYIQVGDVMPVLFAGQCDDAIDRLRGIINLEKDFSNAHLQLGSAYVCRGMYDKAIASLQKARSINEWPVTLAALGYAYAKAGQREEAQKLLADLQERARLGKGSEYYVAVTNAGLGDKDQAFAALEKAYQLRDTNLIYLKVDPYFVSLRADPRFSKLLRQMNFPNVS
jgi:Tfp pilus assembly protein PilF